MTQKPKIIYNPAAGKGGAAKNLPHVQALLAERGFEHDLVLTEGPGHAFELSRAAAAEGRTVVIAAGGDGTANEVINGLMQSGSTAEDRPALGVLPVGSGNDFSFGMGIPHAIEQACDLLVSGERRTIDLGFVSGGDVPQGRYFGNGIGLGFDTVVGFEAAKIRWLHGAASYFAALVKTIFLYHHAPVYEVNYDGVVLRQPFLMVSIMNGRRMGGAFLTAPDSDPADGSFDLCLAGDIPQVMILPVALKFLSGTQAKHPAVNMARAREINVRAVIGNIPAHADGETLCTAGESLSVRICPGALHVVTHLDGARP
jgi:YegS/Rv2252/BmrU family lipid kinase